MSNAPLDRTDLPLHTQKELKRVLAKKSAAGLTEEETAFLKARRDYLTSDEVTAFELDSEADAKPAKKGKGKKADADEEAGDEE